MGHLLGGAAGSLLLVLAACSGSDSDEASADPAENGSAQVATSSAKAVDPCGLVSAAEVTAVLGEQVLAARPNGTSCVYETADAQASSVTIEVKQGGAAAEMETMRRTAGVLRDMGGAAAQQGGAGQDLNAMLSDSGDQPKIGEDALFSANQLLSVRKGDTYISVQPPIMRSRMAGGNPLLSEDDKKQMAIAIAEKAVSRLP